MIVFFNPLSTTPGKQPLPLSLMALAAVVDGQRRWDLVDGNVHVDASAAIVERFREAARESASARSPRVLAVTVMPGPQLAHAVPVCRAIRRSLPDVHIVWGGYFPTQHAETVLASGFVDTVVRSQGERPFLELLEVLDGSRPIETVSGLVWRRPDGTIVRNADAPLTPLDELPDFPYQAIDMNRYLQRTYLGARTVAHVTSFGCPFACSFCAVVAMSNRRWLAQSPARVAAVMTRLQREYGIDSVMMHDMDFFISEPRTLEIAERLTPLGLRWWGLGRIDTLMRYSDSTWEAMAKSGLSMVFCGAETASADTLAAMNKGGTAAPHLALELAARMKRYGVVPEYSFVLGAPPDPEADASRTFAFIRQIKRINPATEVILYTYTPVPRASALLEDAESAGFAFPQSLDEWASDRWTKTMQRRGRDLPWLDTALRTRIRNFERVLNAYYPTVTDKRLTPVRRAVLRAVSAWRYGLGIYAAPLELRAMQRVFRYQRPETTGF